MAWCQGQTGLRIPAARPSTAESLRVKQHIGLPLNSRHLGDSAAAQTGRAKQNLLAATTIAPGIAKRPTSCIWTGGEIKTISARPASQKS